MNVTAVIPNWNRKDLLLQVLDDLRHQTVQPDKVIVIDNGSGDGSAEAASAAGAHVIPLPENRGFSASVNLGIRQASTEWVAILNNDIRLPPEWLAILLHAAGTASAACGKLLSAANPTFLDGSFDLLSRGACAWRAGNGLKDSGIWNTPRPVHFVPFTAALFRRTLFDRVGLLDESFESYLEDVEFGLRCALAGFSGVYVPTAVAHHLGSATLGPWNGETVRRISRNQLLIVAKHYPPRWWTRYGWAVLVAQALWGLVALRHGAGSAWLKGKQQGFESLRNTPRLDQPGLDTILARSEATMRELLSETGFDRYWRTYFHLT